MFFFFFLEEINLENKDFQYLIFESYYAIKLM